MVDTHTHLNLPPLLSQADHYLSLATQTGVNTIIVPGIDPDSNHQALQLASQHSQVYAAIGLHPSLATDLIESQASPKPLFQALNDQLTRSPVALGECGLDYHWITHHPKRLQIIELQQELFLHQLKLAQENKLPLTIHIRDAHSDTLNLLHSHPVKAVLHCFSGDETILRRALDLDLYISFAGNLTFSSSKTLRSLLPLVPANRLLLETDAPYLNPHRGQFPNHPANIASTYTCASQLLNQSLSNLVHQISKNTHSLFRLAI